MIILANLLILVSIIILEQNVSLTKLERLSMKKRLLRRILGVLYFVRFAELYGHNVSNLVNKAILFVDNLKEQVKELVYSITFESLMFERIDFIILQFVVVMLCLFMVIGIDILITMAINSMKDIKRDYNNYVNDFIMFK